MAITNKYQVTFRHKVTKAELIESTTAFTGMDAMLQATVALQGKNYNTGEYIIVRLEPHPSEMEDVDRVVDRLIKQGAK